jgi:hypothetical protein
MFAGLCNGAIGIKSFRVCMISSFISVDSWNFSHQCTILCPTAPISSKDFMAHLSGETRISNIFLRASQWLARFHENSDLFQFLSLCVIIHHSIPILSANHLASTEKLLSASKS